MARKAETQLLISLHIKVRAYRLAVVRKESVAEIWRAAIERGLPALEAEHALDLVELSLMNEDRIDGYSELEWLTLLLHGRTPN